VAEPGDDARQIPGISAGRLEAFADGSLPSPRRSSSWTSTPGPGSSIVTAHRRGLRGELRHHRHHLDRHTVFTPIERIDQLLFLINVVLLMLCNASRSPRVWSPHTSEAGAWSRPHDLRRDFTITAMRWFYARVARRLIRHDADPES
jgi:hypothetical protein